ncbi:hypothetical protein [Saccharothrix algeriensis]|uniref:Uncharacterized protein n=1 Tax=Saccharothrix algeriensis TaxID=173560 RepID=A0A8T8I083_9PSEU|nr:hypothetical protein [Saccharothrix algeriensis]MBM7815144.1 hypothetical protein [Saccharothrix algeriensis]QTR03394.1 hypothetical protein J7S33_31540 [Saccharothrix algeriensis]
MLSPGLLRLLENWSDEIDALMALGDEEFYWEVEHAVAGQFSTEQWEPRDAPWALADAHRVLDRLSSGWFGQDRLLSPVARYVDPSDPKIGAVEAASGGRVNAEKPEKGVWTASLFPSGRTTWDRGEARFRHLGRVRCVVEFDDTRVRVHTIHSLQDFADLVLRFPVPAPDGRARVDWTAVARSYDAVHLTAKGLLTADRVPVPTDWGVAELWGWGSQSTVWFRPADLHIHVATTST